MPVWWQACQKVWLAACLPFHPWLLPGKYTGHHRPVAIASDFCTEAKPLLPKDTTLFMRLLGHQVFSQVAPADSIASYGEQTKMQSMRVTGRVGVRLEECLPSWLWAVIHRSGCLWERMKIQFRKEGGAGVWRWKTVFLLLFPLEPCSPCWQDVLIYSFTPSAQLESWISMPLD